MKLFIEPSEDRTICATVAAVLVLACSIFVLAHYAIGKSALQEEFRTEGEHNQRLFLEAYQLLIDNMTQIALMVTKDEGIVTSYRYGAEAVARDPAEQGGRLGRYHRERIMEQIAPVWQELTDRFAVRQLHFHLAPGDTSFLRVHKPERFGDDLSSLRHLIVDTQIDQTPRQGFELGRIYSGIRSVLPVFYKEHGAENFIGAVEVGSSFDALIEIVKEMSGKELTVLMNADRVKEFMWDVPTDKLIEDCACYLEATTGNLDVTSLIGRVLSDSKALVSDGVQLRVIEHQGQRYAASFFPIQDYIGTRDLRTEAVGRVVIWHSVESQFASLSERTVTIALITAFFGVMLFVLFMLGLRYSRMKLQSVIDTQTQDIKDLHEQSGQLYASVAHELRNPVAVMQMLASDSETWNSDRKKFSLLTTQLMASLDDMQLAINPNLKRAVREEDITVLQLIESSSLIISPVVKATNFTLEVRYDNELDISEQLWRMDTYRTRIAIGNLIKNACRHSEGTRVRLSVGLNNRMLSIVVTDDGKGIPEDQLQRLYDPYERGDSKAAGTGMGLYITKTWIEEMGGSLSYTRLADGSEFRIELPVQPGSELVQAESRTVTADASKIDRTVVIVDDDKTLLMLATKMLAKRFERVKSFLSVGEALSSLADADLIMTDLNMPDLDGYALIHAARTAGCSGAIVVLTADSAPATHQKLAATGADEVLIKPLNREAVERLISKRFSQD